MNMTLSSSSKVNTQCDGGPQGYFTGDTDTLNEPLLFREPPFRIGPAVGTTEANSGIMKALADKNITRIAA